MVDLPKVSLKLIGGAKVLLCFGSEENKMAWKSNGVLDKLFDVLFQWSYRVCVNSR